MFRRTISQINKIKKFESKPEIFKIFDSSEINKIINFYNNLPIKIFNKKQNVIKKAWLQNIDCELDKLYLDKLRSVIGFFKMDNLKCSNGFDQFGLFHESFSPLKLHVDSGFSSDDVIYKQILVPLTEGQTIIFKNRWYNRATSFTIDQEELKFIPASDQNSRSDEHLSQKVFPLDIYNKFLKHENINNLKGLEVELIYNWRVGEILVMDRTLLHCSSSNINIKKLGLTTFTKK